MSGNSKPEKRRGGQTDPTPEEIALLCEIIREERSEELWNGWHPGTTDQSKSQCTGC